MNRTRWARAVLAAFGAVLWTTSASAYQQAEPKKAIPATPLIPGSVPPQSVPAQSEVDEADLAIQQFTKAREEWIAKMQKASLEERQTLSKSRPDPAQTADRLREIAAAHPKTPIAAKALVWVASNVQDQDAVKQLLAEHADRECMAELCLPLAMMKSDEGEAHLRALIEKSPHATVRGTATFFLGYRFQNNDRMQDALPLFRKVVEEHPELLDARLGNLTDRARGAINEAENLQIDKVAPDIQGVDTDGVAFQLSDYRGKVVLLDFWGHW